MKKILKGAPRTHVLIPETSILWHADKTHSVSPEFDSFLTEHAPLVTLEIAIPSVVRSELAFQQTTSASKALDKVVENFGLVSAITGKLHKHRATKDSLKLHVDAKLDKWFHTNHARILPIPCATIDWDTVCENALWRKPPFTYDPKKPDLEKGFRDALILETVANYVATDNRDINIAFVCGDKLLRDTTAARLKSDGRCSCYENLQAFSSYIKLTNEQLTNEFIKSIVRRARAKFYSRDDTNCLYIGAKIGEQVMALVQDKFANPEAVTPYAFPSLLLSPPIWKQIGTINRWVLGPEFQRVVDDGLYHWKTTITSVGQFQDARSAALLNEQRILTVNTIVHWHARVLNDGRFRSLSFDKLELGGSSFRVPTEQDVQHFDLQPQSQQTIPLDIPPI